MENSLKNRTPQRVTDFKGLGEGILFCGSLRVERDGVKILSSAAERESLRRDSLS